MKKLISSLLKKSALIICFSITGCVTTEQVQKKINASESKLKIDIEQRAIKTEKNLQKIVNKIGENLDKLSKTNDSLAELKIKTENFIENNKELTNNLSTNIKNIKNKNIQNYARLTKQLSLTSENIDTIKNDLSKYKQNIAKHFVDIKKDLSSLINKNNKLIFTNKNNISNNKLQILKKMQTEVTLLDTKIEQIQTYANDVFAMTREMTGSLRVALQKQKDVIAEQYQNLTTLTDSFDKTLGKTGQKSIREKADEIFRKAMQLHRQASRNDNPAKLDMALLEYRKGLELDPSNLTVNYNIASILIEQGEKNKALILLKKIQGMDTTGKYKEKIDTIISKISKEEK